MRTRHANRFSTTLTSSMGPTALNASVTTTAGSPASPCYLVIDHDVPASAEIILFDGLFDGTTFRTTALANRYLSGSAAASGITHAIGAKVISAPLGTSLEDIWDEIEAEAASLDAHAAATSVHSATAAATANRIILRDGAGRAKVAVPSAVDDIARKSTVDDHAALTSPHSATAAATASRLVLRDAAGRAKVVDPAVAADIATKGYVDGLAAGNLFVRKATTQTRINNVTLADDAALTLAVAANTTYVVDVMVRYDSSTAADIKFMLTEPAGATFTGLASGLHANAVLSADDSIQAVLTGSGSIFFGGLGVGTFVGMHIHGNLVVGATAGSFTLQWAQGASAATDTRVIAGSHLSLRKVD